MFKKLMFLTVAAGLASTATAHVSVQSPKQVAPGKSANVIIAVPHGCKGEATHSVTVEIPEGFLGAKPQPKSGWELSTKTGDYKQPHKLWGKEVKSGVTQIKWSGGKLEDSQYDEFLIHGVVAKDSSIEPGKKLFFKTKQQCESVTGDWSDTSGKHMHGHDWNKPMMAPAVMIKAAE